MELFQSMRKKVLGNSWLMNKIRVNWIGLLKLSSLLWVVCQFIRFAIIWCVSWLEIIFVLFCLIEIHLLFKLFCMIYILVLLVVTLVVESCLIVLRNVFIGKICFRVLIGFAKNVLCVSRIKVVLKSPVACSNRWRTLPNVFSTCLWILLWICLFLFVVMMQFLLL